MAGRNRAKCRSVFGPARRSSSSSPSWPPCYFCPAPARISPDRSRGSAGSAISPGGMRIGTSTSPSKGIHSTLTAAALCSSFRCSPVIARSDSPRCRPYRRRTVDRQCLFFRRLLDVLPTGAFGIRPHRPCLPSHGSAAPSTSWTDRSPRSHGTQPPSFPFYIAAALFAKDPPWAQSATLAASTVWLTITGLMVFAGYHLC